VPTSSRRRLWIAAPAIAVLAVIAGITLFIYIPDRSAHRSDPTCETVREMIRYTRDLTKHLNEIPISNPFPSPDDLRGWANGIQDWADHMRQYAEQLKKVDPQKELSASILTDNSREIVYLFQYAESHPAPFSGENPPPLWMKRYNDVAADLEMAIHLLAGDCPREPTGTTTTTPTTTPEPAPAAGSTGNTDITDKLLKPSDLARIVGDPDIKEVDKYTDLKVVDNYTDLVDIRTQDVDPPDCAQRLRVGTTFAYYEPGRGATAGSLNRGAQDQVSQLITVWHDSEQPTKVLSQSAYEWEHYCPQPFTTTADNSDAQIHWVPLPNPPSSSTSYITSDRREEKGQPPQICYHVMASRANVLVEDIACGAANADDQAKEIANRILNNFPQ
jgi:PknH-like extracellular domain